jgi:tetratricopeptide (TPR) repeat protein
MACNLSSFLHSCTLALFALLYSCTCTCVCATGVMSFFGFSCFSDGAADSASSTGKDGSKTSSSTSLPPTNSVISNQLAMSHYNVGCTLQEEGKLDEAIKSYRDAIAEDDKFCDAHYNLANGKNTTQQQYTTIASLPLL